MRIQRELDECFREKRPERKVKPGVFQRERRAERRAVQRAKQQNRRDPEKDSLSFAHGKRHDDGKRQGR